MAQAISSLDLQREDIHGDTIGFFLGLILLSLLAILTFYYISPV